MDRLGFWLYKLITAFIALFPLPVVVRLGRAAGLFAWLVAVPYRRLVFHNLTIAFGAEKTPRERRDLARAHFQALGGNLLAGLRIAQMPREEIAALMTIEGMELAQAAVREGRGTVMAISHIGNWELFAQLYPVLFKVQLGTIYQRLGNPLIDADVRASRARLGLHLFERKEGFQGAMALVRAGGTCGILMDQHAGDGGVWCPFFGRLASTSSLVAMMALRTGAALMSGAVYSDGPGKWRLVIRAPLVPTGRSVDELTVRLNLELERQIRRQPADWFWLHNRWKLPRPKFLLATYKRGVVAGDPAALQPFPLVIRSANWLGDAVMSLPAVRAIKRGRPDLRLSILTPAKLADFWNTVPEVDEVIASAPEDSPFAVARRLRGRFEAAVIFPNSMRSALEVWLAGIPRRVGYPGHRRRWLLNQVWTEKKKKEPTAPRHQVHHYLQLAKFIGAELEPATLPLPPAPPAGHLRIGLCPGAEYGPAKRWLPERFREVMARFAHAEGAEWVLFGVAKDAPIAEEILQGFNGRVQNRVGATTLAELIAELRTCAALVTNDTGTMHLAASLGVPVVAIFGSTEPRLTGPLGPGHRVLRHHVECSPCFLRECPLDFRCMKSVEVDEVTGALREVLQAR